MTYEEAEAILGLEKSWLLGGVNVSGVGEAWDGPFVNAIYPVGSIPRGVTAQNGAAASPAVTWPLSEIHLLFTTDVGPNDDWKSSRSTRLCEAHLESEGKMVAQMRQ